MAPANTIVLWKDIHEIADKVCKRFNLRYGKILPETRKRVRHYWECTPCDKCHNTPHIDELNCSEKILYLRIHRLNKPKIPLASKTILNTLAHELAHLKYFAHGPQHRAYEREIAQYIASLGYEV